MVRGEHGPPARHYAKYILKWCLYKHPDGDTTVVALVQKKRLNPIDQGSLPSCSELGFRGWASLAAHLPGLWSAERSWALGQ